MHFIKLSVLVCFSLFFSSCGAHGWNQVTPDSFLPVNSFLFVNKTANISMCTEGMCINAPLRFTASAFSVGKSKHKNGSYAITAAHVCNADNIRDFAKMRFGKDAKVSTLFLLTTNEGKTYKAKPLTYRDDIDICLLYVEKLTDIEPVEIARKQPNRGDRVFNIAAPAGIFSPGMIPILEGRYNGDAKQPRPVHSFLCPLLVVVQDQ